ncbi:hypothetical protein Tco_1482175 [Tanacetum coccineum]
MGRDGGGVVLEGGVGVRKLWVVGLIWGVLQMWALSRRACGGVFVYMRAGVGKSCGGVCFVSAAEEWWGLRRCSPIGVRVGGISVVGSIGLYCVLCVAGMVLLVFVWLWRSGPVGGFCVRFVVWAVCRWWEWMRGGTVCEGRVVGAASYFACVVGVAVGALQSFFCICGVPIERLV